jgi:hypothetical protein
MYNIVMQTPELLVVDNFLNEVTWNAILNQAQVDTWTQTEPDDRYWHITDGPNYKGRKRFSSEAPFNDNFDLWFDAIEKFSKDCKEAEPYVKGYKDIAMRCHAYPVGSKNPWHMDLGATTYTYYLHKEWEINWDSTLLVLPKGSVDFKQKMPLLPGTVQYDSYKDLISLELFEQKEKNRNLIKYGMGTFVSPKPNRLVLIKGGTVHGVSRVDPDAGQNMRLTLTGFYNLFSKRVIK